MEIGSNGSGLGAALSNFTAHPFVFDGVECASMEGLLQSFKFEDLVEQIAVCGLVGFAAKHRGEERDEVWKEVQKLWWQGTAYDRDGNAYQELLDRAFHAIFHQNIKFREVLLGTGDEKLTHSIGKSEKSETCLTEEEFCSRLMNLRDEFRR